MEIQNSFQNLQIKENNFSKTEEQFKFEPELEEKINLIAKEEGYITYSTERKLLSNVGGNYLGILYEVNLKGKTTKGHKEINLFLKKILMGDKLSFISLSEAYLKEIYVYNELSKILQELQEEVNIPEDDMFQIVKCYGVVKKATSECLILQNLSREGYITCDRMKSICPKFAELSVIDLAKFHALGYILEQKRNKYFESAIKSLKAPFIINDKWEEFVRSITENTLERLDCNIVREKLRRFIEEKMINEFASYYKPTKFSTLCHGDFRANNVLVKEENGELTKTMVVDYQLIYYGCPLNDFLYFIFGATDQKFRQEHLERLKDLYYDTLKNFLKHFSVTLEDIYPKSHFEKDYKERLDYGLVMALMLLPFILASEEDVPDFSETELSDVKLSKDDTLFGDRINGVIDDYIKWGYL